MEVASSRKNTFKDSEFLKVSLFSSSKERSMEKGAWITNSKDMWRGYFVCPFNTTKMVVSVNWMSSDINQINTTVSSECVLIFLDTAQEWENMKSSVVSLYSKVPTRIVVCKSEETLNIANEIKGIAFTNGSAEELRNLIDKSDKGEYEKLANYFNKYDTDKSGYIEIAELPNLALALGEDPQSESFKQSLLVFDVNKDNKISLEEFIKYWKIGRQNTLTLSKIYEFENYLKDNIYSLINYDNFLKEIKAVKTKKEDKTNKLQISIKTKDKVKIVTRIEGRIAIGGSKRLEAVRTFISKFSDNLDPIHENWVNISVFLKSETITSKVARTYLEQFRENLLKFAETNYVPGLSGFLNNFLNFISFDRQCSSSLLFRLKFDVESMIKESCDALVKIVQSISEKDKGFDLAIKVYSEELIEELFKNNENLGSFLRNSEVDIDSSSVKSLLKTLFLNLNKNYQSNLGLLQFLFAPNDFKMEFNGPINEMIDQNLNKILGLNLSTFSKLINFIKLNLNETLLKSMKRLEIGFNLFDIFLNLQIYSDTLWESKVSL
jgi:hypothetical protein